MIELNLLCYKHYETKDSDGIDEVSELMVEFNEHSGEGDYLLQWALIGLDSDPLNPFHLRTLLMVYWANNEFEKVLEIHKKLTDAYGNIDYQDNEINQFIKEGKYQ
jgi:hypothetical protein